ncbi:hypothetical protein HUJ05_012254 [Dendroctonus ponderosae]|nr:hypothetical protein HUJ05_012253 [Dendroctonus ponderosae]KAH1002087.1 hypothetical protein HUJ05_012254 [Dendroctonus ponderosae]
MVHMKIRITEDTTQTDNSHQHRILSAVRGRLRQVAASLQAAVRFRRFSRRGTTAPDWFVDKSHQEDNADVGEEPQHGCWGYRVVFDPALPIYYKMRYRQIVPVPPPSPSYVLPR